MIVAVPYYRIPRDEDGRPSREFDRPFEMALRWWPEITIAADMVSATAKNPGDPLHRGRAALHQLRDAADISQRQLDAAVCYLRDAIDYYEAGPDEPYPGRNAEAARDLHELLAELTS